MIFVGRDRELEVLDNLWESPRATLLILYGRRRVGKTRLLTHWLQQRIRRGFYWVAEPSSSLSQLRSFSQALMRFMDDEADIPPEFTFSTWELAFRQLALYAQQERTVLFLDEVTYLIDVDPNFVGILQKVWDRWLSNSKIMLALAGSQMGLMRRHLLDYDAPLHGRATTQMQLLPLPYGATQNYFPEYNAIDRVNLYSMWGGVPAYWERLNPQYDIWENLRRNTLPAHSWMTDESRILLQDFITDLHNYVGILRAIADGQRAIGQIAKRTGLTSSKASFYLSVLRDTGFVAREIPISQRGTDSRRGRYHVTDPYLRFFYRFLSAYQSKLALGQMDAMLAMIQADLPVFIQENSWQELCRQWVLLASGMEALPLAIEEVGSEWSRSYTLDIVGISDADPALLLGDCFWTSEPMGQEAISELMHKTAPIVTKMRDGVCDVHYILFSSAGWSDDAQRYATTLVTTKPIRRKRWQLVSVKLVDLVELDADLIAWSV